MPLAVRVPLILVKVMQLPSILQGESLTRLSQGAVVTVPHYIGEAKSDIRGIKSGWYAMDRDGNLSSGPFPSHEECLSRITQPTNGSKAFDGAA